MAERTQTQTNSKQEALSSAKAKKSSRKPRPDEVLDKAIVALAAAIDAKGSPQQYMRFLGLLLRQEGKRAAAGRQIARYDIITGRKIPPRNPPFAVSHTEFPRSFDAAEAAFSAAAKFGLDGCGKGGLAGYLQMLAQRYPMSYAELYLVILKQQCRASFLDLKKEHKKIASGRNDTNARPKPRVENPTGGDFTESAPGFSLTEATHVGGAKVGSDGCGKDGPVGYVMMLALRYRRTIWRFLGSMLDDELRREKFQTSNSSEPARRTAPKARSPV